MESPILWPNLRFFRLLRSRSFKFHLIRESNFHAVVYQIIQWRKFSILIADKRSKHFCEIEVQLSFDVISWALAKRDEGRLSVLIKLECNLPIQRPSSNIIPFQANFV